MPTEVTVSRKELRQIDALVDAYLGKREIIGNFGKSLIDAISISQQLKPYVHTLKLRLKDPDHLRDKLIRKLREHKKERIPFGVTADNLLVRINDLVGIRILHLYTQQIREIDIGLKQIVDELRCKLLEGPAARTWDDESRSLFAKLGIETKESPSLYTSVHYVVESASKTRVTCEIQVRTLMEEVWGEVDHTINYPHKIGSVACREQLAVLARVTSSATRLVDSIFRTVDDYEVARVAIRRPRKRTGKKRKKVV